MLSYMKPVQIKIICNQRCNWRWPGCASLPACSIGGRRIRKPWAV